MGKPREELAIAAFVFQQAVAGTYLAHVPAGEFRRAQAAVSGDSVDLAFCDPDVAGRTAATVATLHAGEA
jgi:hypothetical protein